MDESKPPILLSKFRLHSASQRTCVANDPVPVGLARSAEFNAGERHSRSGQTEARRNDPSDGPLVAVYYRNEEEVHEGFLIALRAMGVVADVEQQPEPVTPPVSGVKP